MPEYTIRDPQSGKTVTLRGDSPPTEQELEHIFSSLPGAQEEAPKGVATKPERTWGDTAIDALPAIGGTLGGVVGGVGGTVAGMGVGGVPGALGGAALGGAAGEAFKQLINRALGRAVEQPTSMGEAASDIASEGGKQLAYEAGGQLIGKGLAVGGKALIKNAYKPTKEALKASPTLVEDIANYGIGNSERGAAKAKALTDASRSTADSMVNKATIAGTKIRRQDLLDSLIVNPKGHESTFDLISARAEQTPGLDMLARKEANIIADNPAMLTPNRVQEIMRAEGNAGRRIFEGAENADLQKQVAADLNAGARTSLNKVVPGFEAQNAETARRLAMLDTVNKSLEDRAGKAITPDSLGRYMLWKTLVGGGGYIAGGPLGAASVLTAQSIAKNPRVEGAVGRGMFKLGNSHIPQTALRAGERMMNDGKPKTKVQKAKVDSLYKRYLEEGNNEQ